MGKPRVALQMYTVRDEAAKDFAGTMRKVGQIGYAGAELAGTGGLSAKELKALCDESGLVPVGSHVGIADFEKQLNQVIEYYGTVGCKFVGVPALPGDMRNPAGFRRAAAIMNQAGAELKKVGMAMYYHHHAFEFERVEGERGIDILLKETDPALVSIETDVYWTQYGGEDPAALIRANSGRFRLIHLKDMIGSGDKRTYAEIGEGIIDFQAIFAASEAQGAEWYIVEQDICQRPSLESAALSLKNLKKWGKA